MARMTSNLWLKGQLMRPWCSSRDESQAYKLCWVYPVSIPALPSPGRALLLDGQCVDQWGSSNCPKGVGTLSAHHGPSGIWVGWDLSLEPNSWDWPRSQDPQSMTADIPPALSFTYPMLPPPQIYWLGNWPPWLMMPYSVFCAFLCLLSHHTSLPFL